MVWDIIGDTRPHDDLQPGKTVTDLLPDIVPRSTAIIKEPAGPFKHEGIEKVVINPRLPEDHENVGITHSQVYFSTSVWL